jgi:septation ring formation regulator EzrA
MEPSEKEYGNLKKRIDSVDVEIGMKEAAYNAVSRKLDEHNQELEKIR